jgi:hypothetical protein
LCALALSLFLCASADCAKDHIDYFNYSSKSDIFEFSFNYPANWKVNGESEPREGYLVLTFVLPVYELSFETDYRAAIVFLISPTRDNGGVVRDFRQKARLYEGAGEVLFKSEEVIDGHGAVELATVVKKVRGKEKNSGGFEAVNHRILTEKDGFIYNINLSVNEQNYEEYKEII